MEMVKKINSSVSTRKEMWSDFILQQYYSNYYNSLSLKELDDNFKEDLKTIAKSMAKLNSYEKKEMIKILSEVINIYLENKVNKELQLSLSQIFKRI